jgi:hypothetical protein
MVDGRVKKLTGRPFTDSKIVLSHGTPSNGTLMADLQLRASVIGLVCRSLSELVPRGIFSIDEA